MTLLELHRRGELAARYPEVRGLLAGDDGAELLRAGNLLARLDPDDVLRRHPATPVLSVAITGHGTLGGLVPPLTAELARHGLLVRPHVSRFDGWVFDLADPGGELYRGGADLVLCVLDPAVVTDEVPAPWTVPDAERVLAEKVTLIERLAARYAAHGTGCLVLNTLPLPRRFSAQLVDHRSRARLGAAWRRANARLLDLAAAHPSIVVVDLEPIVGVGLPVEDARMSVYARTHLSAELLAAYAREVGHLGRHLAGRTAKCLVLDLDETVWGGVLGDDGPDGIEVSEGYRGEAFRAFQRVVKQLGAQGVLVAAVSKNDLEPVREVLRTHPGMTLTEADFVRVTANWRPKHENIVELARVLNIGTDSLVFVDDSPYERGLVRRELPEVTVVAIGAEPARHVEDLLRDGWFDVREVTTVDRVRLATYREEARRTDFLAGFDSIEDYLRELGVTVRLTAATPGDVARLSQLTLRTNQFNLTTRRLQPAQVAALLADPDALALAIRSADRFGDNGLVGALFGRRRGQALHLENMLLSCRVFARGIEQACLAAVLRRTREAGAEAVYGEYRPSAKNAKVAGLYPGNGFAAAGAGLFRHDLTAVPPGPEHVDLVEEWSLPGFELAPDGPLGG